MMRCAIIAFFLTCVTFAQTDIEIVQFSASFVKDNEIELKARTGESSSNDIGDTKTILDFFKNK